MVWDNYLTPEGIDTARLAIILAMTPDQVSEKELIFQYQKMGLKTAVTTIYGFAMGTQTAVVRNIINLCLNTHVIEKKRGHIHPVAHCVLETAQSTRAADAIGQNYCFKAAVVRDRSVFSLCFYGNLGMHELSSHKTIGVGQQILGE